MEEGRGKPGKGSSGFRLGASRLLQRFHLTRITAQSFAVAVCATLRRLHGGIGRVLPVDLPVDPPNNGPRSGVPGTLRP